MRHDTLLLVLVPLYLIVVAALVIAQLARNETKPHANESPVATEDKAPAVNNSDDAVSQPVGSIGTPGLTPSCEKELRHTADLLRFFANRIQMGEEAQSVVADMRQQEKKISAVCE